MIYTIYYRIIIEIIVFYVYDKTIVYHIHVKIKYYS
jgi:hypothetical protein